MSERKLNSRQRAYLRSLAADIQPIFQIGKGGINDNMIKMIDEALEARELVKGSVLQTADVSAGEALSIICERTGAIPVAAMGRKLTVYRPSKQNKKIEI